MRKKVADCLSYIRKITDFKPDVALVLGSGLGAYTQEMEDIVCVIPYARIPGFPVSTVSGHAGKFIMGYIKGVAVIIMDGRVHYYEGYTPEEVVLPLRVMRAMGAKILFLTNAAGGINRSYQPGDLVILKDHISLFVPNPLGGPNDPEEGPRFPDMTNVYDPKLRKRVMDYAKSDGIALKEGVYCQLTGPTYETPAEIRLLGMLGADLVGMSTVMEAVVANHIGMSICAVSLVTNMAAGINVVPLSHEEVRLTGRDSAPRFARLVTLALQAIKDTMELSKS